MMPHPNPAPHREHSQEHVVVIDEKEELLLAVRELCSHPEDEVLHLYSCSVERHLATWESGWLWFTLTMAAENSA